MKGLLITFEGVEGCGKSTQVKRLAQRVKEWGRDVLVTREPGGTAIGEKIREILLNPDNAALSDTAELLLYAAARAQHVDEVIKPALANGTIVLCDRYVDSTTAYQGGGRGASRELLDQLRRIATSGLDADLTLLLDVPVDEGLERAKSRTAADRIEQEKIDFHQRVRDAYLVLAEQEPERIHVIDSTNPIDAVANEAWNIVSGLFAKSDA